MTDPGTDVRGVTVVDDPRDLAPDVLGAWRSLADEVSQPYSTPEWCLAFWEKMHVPDGSALRVVVVDDETRIVGVAPLYASLPDRLGSVTWWTLGAGIGQRTGLLARASHEDAVADAVTAAAIRDTAPPSVVKLPAAHAGAAWGPRLRDRWPARRRPFLAERRVVAPAVTTHADGYKAWAAGRSKNLRRQIRRSRRDLVAAGGEVRVATTVEELSVALPAFFRTHHERMGAVTSIGESHEAALTAAVTALARRDPSRVRLWHVRVGDEIVATDLHVVAGDRMCAFNGGIATGWESHSPGTVLLARAIEDAHGLGLRTVDLGAGEMSYKARFADSDEPVVWSTLVPRGPRSAIESVRMLPDDARRAAREVAARLPDEHVARLRGLLRR